MVEMGEGIGASFIGAMGAGVGAQPAAKHIVLRTKTPREIGFFIYFLV
jgi:hypothetical protein